MAYFFAYGMASRNEGMPYALVDTGTHAGLRFPFQCCDEGSRQDGERNAHIYRLLANPTTEAHARAHAHMYVRVYISMLAFRVRDARVAVHLHGLGPSGMFEGWQDSSKNRTWGLVLVPAESRCTLRCAQPPYGVATHTHTD